MLNYCIYENIKGKLYPFQYFNNLDSVYDYLLKYLSGWKAKLIKKHLALYKWECSFTLEFNENEYINILILRD